MTVASRAVMMAVMTEARTTDVEQEGHTSLTISDVRQTSHCVAVEQVGGLSHDVGDGGDVVAGTVVVW